MFGKKVFGDEDYKMKEKYSTNNLVVANLQRISRTVTNFGPRIEKTEQKYIFEMIVEQKIKYREIFTGFIANDEEEGFNLPFVINPEPFTDYFPETIGREIPKLSLIWILNDINFPKNKKKLKRK